MNIYQANIRLKELSYEDKLFSSKIEAYNWVKQKIMEELNVISFKDNSIYIRDFHFEIMHIGEV